MLRLLVRQCCRDATRSSNSRQTLDSASHPVCVHTTSAAIRSHPYATIAHLLHARFCSTQSQNPRSESSVQDRNSSDDRKQLETDSEKSPAVQNRSTPTPVIYHPSTAVDPRVLKQEERYRRRYDVMPSEVLVYENAQKCRFLRWLFGALGGGAMLSWLNLYSVVFQNYTRYNESNEALAKFIEWITLYKQIPDLPYHTQVFIFLEVALVASTLIFCVHQSLNRQLVRMYMDTDYGRFKAVFVETNKYNERTVQFTCKDVKPVSHPVPRFQNYTIKGLPYYLSESDFKHPKYYAYFRGAFEEILGNKYTQ